MFLSTFNEHLIRITHILKSFHACRYISCEHFEVKRCIETCLKHNRYISCEHFEAKSCIDLCKTQHGVVQTDQFDIHMHCKRFVRIRGAIPQFSGYYQSVEVGETSQRNRQFYDTCSVHF